MTQADPAKLSVSAAESAPCVTPAAIEAAISTEHYFTALDGATGGGGSVPAATGMALSRVTFCVLVLSNGFVVTGESACVDVRNFDARLGRQYAHQKAIDKLWELMGYTLKDQLASQTV